MERELILNFISQNYQNLIKNNCKRLTLYLFGLNDNSIYQKFNDDKNKVICFDLKLPRIDKKLYPLEYMKQNNLLDFVTNLNDGEIYNKDSILDEIDPYSGKKLNDFDFNYLSIYPIKNADLVIGGLFIYQNNDEKIKINGLNKLISELENNYFVEIEQNIKDLIDFDFDYVLKKGIYSYQSNPNIEIDNFVNRHNVVKKKLAYPYDDITLYFLKKENEDTKLLNLSTIKYTRLSSVFTCIILETKLKEVLSFSQQLNEEIDYYDCEDSFYLVLINHKCKNKDLKIHLKDLNCYNVLLKAPTDVNNKMDLKKVVDYIKMERPLKFDLDKYKDYLNDSHQEEYQMSVKNIDNRLIVDNENQNFGILINNLPIDFRFEQNFDNWNKKTINKLNKNRDKNILNNYLCVNTSVIASRKYKEIYKKYEGLNLNLILHLDKMTIKEKLIKDLVDLSSKNINFYLDSSLYFNFKYLDLIKIIKGIYLTKEEFTAMKEAKTELVRLIIGYYLDQNLVFIVENDDEQFKLNNKNIYYVRGVNYGKEKE